MGFICFLLFVGLLYLGYQQYRTQKRLNAVAAAFDHICPLGDLDA